MNRVSESDESADGVVDVVVGDDAGVANAEVGALLDETAYTQFTAG